MDVMGCSPKISCFWFICVWFVVIFRTTDGGSITWYEPPPVKTETDNTVPSTADGIQLFKGRSGSLSWNFTLTGEPFASATLKSKTTTVASIQPAFGVVAVTPGFEDRFNVSWINSQKATLIIFNVTTDDEGYFSCETSTVVQSAFKVWTRKIQVAVVDPPVITQISPNQTVNESDVVPFNCIAEGKPTPNINRTRLSDNSVVNSTIHITGKQDEGVYRCTADNGVGDPVTADFFITVQNYGPENTNLTTNLSADNTVVVNTNFKLICSAQANPPAKYRFYKEQESLFNKTAGSNVAEHTTSVSERVNQVEFSCTPFNDLYGDGPTKKITVTVHYSPEIAGVSSDKDICEGSLVTLSCNTTGNPTPSITWTRVFDNGTESAPLLRAVDGKYVMSNITRSLNGTYRCTANNEVGDPVNRTVRVTVRYSASVDRIVNSSNTVNEGGPFNMTCEVSAGDPESNVYWIKVDNGQRFNGSILNFANINRNDTGEYRCVAENHCRSHSGKQFVDVYYPPEFIKNETEKAIPVTKSDTINVTAKGNPRPSFVWKNASGSVKTNNSVLSLIKVADSDTGNYTCTATNELGSVNFTILVRVTRGNVTVDATVEGEYSQDYDDLSKPGTKAFVKPFEEGVKKSYKNTDHFGGIKVLRIRKGSVIVTFVLYFTTPVTLNEGLAELRGAVDNGTIGPYTVTDLKIIPDVNPTTTPVLSTGSTTAPVKTTKKTTQKPTDHLPWDIIGAVVGGVVVMVVIIAVVAWCVHKKRKCRRKGSKVCNSESEVALRGQVNGGYADSGPPSANGPNRTDTSVLLHEQPTAAAPPTYGVVDKKKKKEKKADKKEDNNVAKQDVPDYAVVDKSHKKKKEVVEDAYAQVDMSKKSKKKPKPGEMLYADLGEFQQRDMPAVSTSPAPLPPIKRPPAYEETQYADITQFMKGEATLPDTNNSQGTEMTSANVEGGKEKPENTANEGGKEEKPKETRM